MTKNTHNIRRFGIIMGIQVTGAVLETPAGQTERRRRSNGVKIVPPVSARVHFICEQCGRSIWRIPSHAARTNRAFCSRACRNAFHVPMEERFWAKVDKQDGGCWIWMGGKSSAGYGTFNIGSSRADSRYDNAHRIAYRLIVGPIPDGLHLDHLCRNPACVNPEHLEPVTPQENILRGISPTTRIHLSGKCRRGHDMTGDNAYIAPSGSRQCRACRRLRREGGAS